MSKRSSFDVQSPIFRPLWTRLLITGICLAWTGYEIANSNVFWAMLFGAAGLYLVYAFFIAWDDGAFDENQEQNGDDTKSSQDPTEGS